MRISDWSSDVCSSDLTVWVGLSAGSMVMTPEVGEDFIQWRPPHGDASTLGLVDFSISPHLAPDGAPGNSMAEAEEWPGGISGPAYAIADPPASAVGDRACKGLSNGHWTVLFAR